VNFLYEEDVMQKIRPFLWFDETLEEAINFYASIFPDARILSVQRGSDAKAFTASFTLAGQEFMGLNGGPHFKFTEAVSFFVSCRDQDEVDRYWNALLDGGTAQQCGWLKDRFGLSWQIIPEALMRLMADPDAAKAGRVRDAMMTMIKIDIAGLEKAAA
jgi:predicted 3-demethylubiquinone-9 3-methyltransferase (glyoxalase superfamily)